MRGYDDIIEHKAHKSLRHPPMSIEDRAAQFSPFAALTGYEEAIEKAGRFAEAKARIGEDDDSLSRTIAKLREGMTISVLFFDYGTESTEEADGIILSLDNKKLVLSDGKKIPLENILSISKE